ncbi:translation initiation factor IF-2-like [Podarcis raffonei]|uniref:translation initiation factor IF-2-like n=1 Tax=Podarcis raffonei TaxID=65483 RepID=UPI0023299C80|nr:translation initiation factor IF-2-like [Podarcis raffonei]
MPPPAQKGPWLWGSAWVRTHSSSRRGWSPQPLPQAAAARGSPNPNPGSGADEGPGVPIPSAGLPGRPLRSAREAGLEASQCGGGSPEGSPSASLGGDGGWQRERERRRLRAAAGALRGRRTGFRFPPSLPPSLRLGSRKRKWPGRSPWNRSRTGKPPPGEEMFRSQAGPPTDSWAKREEERGRKRRRRGKEGGRRGKGSHVDGSGPSIPSSSSHVSGRASQSSTVSIFLPGESQFWFWFWGGKQTRCLKDPLWSRAAFAPMDGSSRGSRIAECSFEKDVVEKGKQNDQAGGATSP